ncbi:MAG: endonuclease [Candidatus Thermoplasmatota archaeon]|nr:endonuclease [Candidatus Thermoplasmatota archaeon]MCL5962773.1 endonuclease [Candidatus Thermoplasmatota archaeon]
MNDLMNLYNSLFKTYGDLHWWPGDSRDDVIIGAVLTQRTSWKNVEMSLKNLKEHGYEKIKDIMGIDIDTLKRLIKPSGFYNNKSIVLKNIASFFSDSMFEKFLDDRYSTELLRDELLHVKGIGCETADSILLYAFDRPVFVIDGYTKRFADRLGWNIGNDYNSQQQYFMLNIDKNINVYKNFHAMIVEHSKNICKKNPVCKMCMFSYICRHNLFSS